VSQADISQCNCHVRFTPESNVPARFAIKFGCSRVAFVGSRLYLPTTSKIKKKRAKGLESSTQCRRFSCRANADYLSREFQGCQFSLDTRGGAQVHHEKRQPKYSFVRRTRSLFDAEAREADIPVSKFYFVPLSKNKFEFFLATSLRVGITSQHNGVIRPRFVMLSH